MGYKFAIDRGGTFTDVYVEYPDKTQFVYKLLSEDFHYKDAPSEAIRRLISKVDASISFVDIFIDNYDFQFYCRIIA